MEIKTIQIDSDTFLVFKGTTYIQINVKDIVSLEAFDKYVLITIQSGKRFTVCCSLTDITKHLCFEYIVVTKGFLINKRYILELTKKVNDKSVYVLMLDDVFFTTREVSDYIAKRIIKQL